MACGRCSSDLRSEFPAEVYVHLLDLQDLNSPPVLVFPEITVCLHCGFSEFILPEPELSLLAQKKQLDNKKLPERPTNCRR
jgi:hypothetical protein